MPHDHEHADHLDSDEHAPACRCPDCDPDRYTDPLREEHDTSARW